MTWKIRKTVLATALASAVAVLAVACGSDSDAEPGAPADTPIPATATSVPGPLPTATPAGIDVGEPNGIADYAALVAALEAAGVDRAASDQAFPPTFFSAYGRSIEVGGNQDAEFPAVVFMFDSIAARVEAQGTVDLRAGTAGGLSSALRSSALAT
ncbi:MAG: hypothetical protein O2921_01640 [Chloroflexi bacterium]|nr:hypothetical protein [Chloroflexota bacterium]